LWKDVRDEDRERFAERYILELIDWRENGDPCFYENHHLSPQPIDASVQDGGEESWIFYNTTKFSGKKLVVHPGSPYVSVETGVHTVFVWSGNGTYGGIPVQGGSPGDDELFVTHERAVRGVEVHNAGSQDLVVIKFFGPDIHPDAPVIERR
jgi:hypothetical protein